jgi:hypothetical protein
MNMTQWGWAKWFRQLVKYEARTTLTPKTTAISGMLMMQEAPPMTVIYRRLQWEGESHGPIEEEQEELGVPAGASIDRRSIVNF